MITVTIEVRNIENTLLASSSDTGQACLVYENEYGPGDTIVLKSSERKQYLYIRLDDAMDENFVYLDGNEFRFTIPFAEKKTSYSPKTFTGSLHTITVRLASSEEIGSYKNLAKNEYDQHENISLFPHASANVETRGEAVFAARNAINGNCISYSHGGWPFESWGINQRDDAAFTVEFGRPVLIDKINLVLRADFPHDNYWEQVTLYFSDGTSLVENLVKSGKLQTISFPPKQVEWVTLTELIKSNDPALFPALTQFEAFGQEAE